MYEIDPQSLTWVIHIQLSPRVVVDPNSVSRRDPALSVALFEDADRVPQQGELVIAVQPDPDDADFIGFASVESIDIEHQLIYLRVDWDSFIEDPVAAGRIHYAVSNETVQPLQLPGDASNSTTPAPRVLVG